MKKLLIGLTLLSSLSAMANVQELAECLNSKGKLVKFVARDGNDMGRQATNDSSAEEFTYWFSDYDRRGQSEIVQSDEDELKFQYSNITRSYGFIDWDNSPHFHVDGLQVPGVYFGNKEVYTIDFKSGNGKMTSYSRYEKSLKDLEDKYSHTFSKTFTQCKNLTL
jgi:hypothetical protein